MSINFRPMLAAQADLATLDYRDLWLSPKLDGVRAIVIDGVVMSRSLKPIPNEHVQTMFRHFEFYDGELIVGDPTSKSVYRDTASGVMSAKGSPNVTFFVFDHIESPEEDFNIRNAILENTGNVKVVDQHPIKDRVELDRIEAMYLRKGYEGVMLRKARGPNSKYKFGRSTVKSQALLKLKRFVDAEFVVIGFEERMHNGNEATTNALGHTERSTHKQNKTGRGDLGALILRTQEGLEFTCGTGFDDATRREIWGNKEKYVGRLAKVKHFPIGVKDLPRFPVFMGFRDENDMS